MRRPGSGATVRAKRSAAHKKYGRTKRVMKPAVAAEDRKVVVCYSLPLWQVEEISSRASQAGMAKSSFVAAMIETSLAGLVLVGQAVEVEETEIELGEMGDVSIDD